MEPGKSELAHSGFAVVLLFQHFTGLKKKIRGKLGKTWAVLELLVLFDQGDYKDKCHVLERKAVHDAVARHICQLGGLLCPFCISTKLLALSLLYINNSVFWMREPQKAAVGVCVGGLATDAFNLFERSLSLHSEVWLLIAASLWFGYSPLFIFLFYL